MSIISYAQNFEDVLLNRVFGSLNYGFYIDIGAYHPVDDSVTKAFYDRGWSGINIEPGEIFEELVAARPRDVNLRMAVFDRSGEITFAQYSGWHAGLSHVREDGSGSIAALSGQPGAEMRSVACDTLTNILNVHAPRRPIAFLKIDAGGSHLAIIRSTDWRTIRPTVLVIEATMPLSTQLDNQDWEPILLEQGYVRAYFDGINCFYVPEERSDLLRHFELPVNVLDGFTRPNPAAVSACREELRVAQERIYAISTELDRTNAENTKFQAQNAVLHEQNAVYAGLIRTNSDTISELRRQCDERVAGSQADYDARLAALRSDYNARVAALRSDYDARVAASQSDCDARVTALQSDCGARVTALQSDSDARLAALQSDCDARLVASQADRDRLESQLHSAAQREVILMGETARLYRLVRELRWPDGPRAVRAVLPLARILRRLRGTRPPAVLPMEATIASLTQLALGGNLPAPAPVQRRSLARRLALLCCAPVRLFARSLAWCGRTFLNGGIRGELAQLNDKLQLLPFTTGELAHLNDKLQLLLNQFEQSQPNLTQGDSPDGRFTTGELTTLQAEVRQFGKMLETTLLTLALERDGPHTEGRSCADVDGLPLRAFP